MRLIQVHVPPDVHRAVREALEEADLEYFFANESGGQEGFIATIPVPAGAVQSVLELLYEAGLPASALTIVTEAAQTNVANEDAINEQFVEGPKGDAGVAYPLLRERAEDLKPGRRTYLAFAALSAIVAVGGLLLNSAIIIVGAMVIAPFAGSTLSASVGWVLGDREMIVDSAVSQTIGLVVAFVSAVGMSFLLLRSGFVPPSLVVSKIDQVSAFLTPGLLTFAIALAAGFAGALALATDLPVSIAGVAVAAAIVPAAGTAGIGFVWGEPLIVLGAVVLLLMNIVFINLASYVGLVSLGYRSSVIRSLPNHVNATLRTGLYVVLVAGFLSMVVFTSMATYQHISYERDVNQAVETALEAEDYASLELVSVKTEYNDMNVLGSVESVTVTVSRTTDSDYEEFARELQRRIIRNTDRPVTINVRFIDYQQEKAPEAASNVSVDDSKTDLLGTGGRSVVTLHPGSIANPLLTA